MKFENNETNPGAHRIIYKLAPNAMVDFMLELYRHAFPNISFEGVHYIDTECGSFAALIANNAYVVNCVAMIPWGISPIRRIDPNDVPINCNSPKEYPGRIFEFGDLGKHLYSYQVDETYYDIEVCYMDGNVLCTDFYGPYHNDSDDAYYPQTAIIDPIVSPDVQPGHVEILAYRQDPKIGRWYVSARNVYPEFLTEDHLLNDIRRYAAVYETSHPYAALANVISDGKKYTVLLDVREEDPKSYDCIHATYQLAKREVYLGEDAYPTSFDSIEQIWYLVPEHEHWELADKPNPAMKEFCKFKSASIHLEPKKLSILDGRRYSALAQAAEDIGIIQYGLIADRVPAFELKSISRITALGMDHIPELIDEINAVNKEANQRIRNLIRKGIIKIG